ncbi:hypothetical protein [Chromobacterium phragmitis]|uniref:hypothetical protein n=1 Tax=Chromobacterium phragmitis TaxID=2202141 RepID=UPI00143D5A0A|nr:hypothetical protein [Chromobacterium phragmitis]
MRNIDHYPVDQQAQVRELQSRTWLNISRGVLLISLAVLPWTFGLALLKWLGAL